MLIDTCASGGRRNDIETLRRAVPLLRSDFIFDPVAQQNHTMGIAEWMPYYGTGVDSSNTYTFHSQMCPWITCSYDMRRRDLDYNALRKRHAEWKRLASLMLKDFYLLMPYSTEDTVWVAWQFDDPEKGNGAVFAFRRAKSIYETASLKLRGLDASATYELDDLDADQPRQVTGRELLDGLTVSIPKPAHSKIFVYHRKL